jgi:hypothetical protein
MREYREGGKKAQQQIGQDIITYQHITINALQITIVQHYGILSTTATFHFPQTSEPTPRRPTAAFGNVSEARINGRAPQKTEQNAPVFQSQLSNFAAARTKCSINPVVRVFWGDGEGEVCPSVHMW